MHIFYLEGALRGGETMKYRALLTGSLNSAIDDLFSLSGSLLNCVTTSVRYDDMVRHIKVFLPNIFIICLSNENNALYSCVEKLKAECIKADVTMAIMGDKSDCDQFVRQTGFEPELIFVKPITITSIMNKISDAMEEKEKNRKLEEQRLLAETADIQKQQEKKHILVIDDDVSMLRSIKEQLEDDYNIGTAISGSIALRFLEKKTTDLILLDYEMPGETGADILKQLRLKSNTKNIPVIFLTGVSDVERIKNVLSMKPQGYLLKPVDRQKLLGIIEETLNKDN